MMAVFKELVDVLIQYGLQGFLLILLVLVLLKPERAEQWKALLLMPCFRFFKWGSKGYIAARVGGSATEFLQKHIALLSPSTRSVKVRIRWVTSPRDPVLSEDGTLILRMKETNDQTRNILTATRVALPHVVCPTLRPNLQQYARSAIDLTLLRKLAEKLGTHARPIFRRYFFEPEVEEDEKVGQLFRKLLILDRCGILVAVFLEELSTFGEALYTNSDTSDQTSEVLAFLEFLLVIAQREVYEHVPLDYHSARLHVGILMLAISAKTKTAGVQPYLRRIDLMVRGGCDSIYILVYPQSKSFLKRILTGTEADQRITLASQSVVHGVGQVPDTREGVCQIALFRRNTLFSDSAFAEKLDALGIREGAHVQGRVLDLAEEVGLVDIMGVNGYIQRKDCSWRTIDTCTDILAEGETSQFIVQGIDTARHSLALTKRDPKDDPWESERMPNVGDTMEVRIIGFSGITYIAEYLDKIEVLIPVYEVSWLGVEPDQREKLLNTTQRILVYEKSAEQRSLRGSIRRLEEDPWPKIHERYPKGTELRVSVLDVSQHGVAVELPEGVKGILPPETMIKGGYEYADYENTVVKGQRLDVIVSKVFLKKQKIRLELKRAVDQTEE